MHCPVDKAPLIGVEYEDIEIDYCTECEGIWLDAGELELLFGDPEAGRAFLADMEPRVPRGEKPRRCPLCHAKMTKVTTKGQGSITLDQCPRGDGLWLDGGELEAMLRQGGSASADRVNRFLRELLRISEEQPEEGTVS